MTRCIHQLFETQAYQSPDAVAAALEGNQITYRQLNHKANQLAHYLRGLGVGPEVLVAICMERSVEVLVAILGVLKAGGAYVPLEPTYPKERLAFMLDDADVAVLLTQRKLLSRLPEVICHPPSAMRHPIAIHLDIDWELIARECAENPISGVTAENLAYVIFTSGSTGQPKGVTIQHSSLVNYNTFARKEYALGSTDRVLQFAPISFDASVEEIFPTLTSGATLMLRTDAILDPLLCLRKCREWNVTVLSLPTAYWHELGARLAVNFSELPPSLRLVVLGGERALPQWVSKWRENAPNVRLINTYGPTEATVIATLCDVSDSTTTEDWSGEVPIGRPIANTRIDLLNVDGCPVATGMPGELCISGSALSRGYLNRPDLTAESFVPNPFSGEPGDCLYKTGDLARCRPGGNLEFLGRIDDQVKIRGFRIEPREIEAALEKHPGMRQVVVLAREDTANNKRLVAYCVADEKQVPTASELRTFLTAQVPDHMLPHAFVMLDAFPLMPNGKVDRKMLPMPSALRYGPREGYLPPRSRLEYALVEMWQEILGLGNVGICDNFFELGGDSLKGARFISRLQAELGEYIYIVALFDASTVADLAQYLCKHYPDAVERSFGLESLHGVERKRDQTLSNRRQKLDPQIVDQFRQLIPPLPRRDMLDASKNPQAIFILSPPRSGSTLLRVMLAGHPHLFAPQELDLLSFNTLEERRASRLSGGNVGFLEGTIRAIMEIKSCDATAAKDIMQDYERQKLTTVQFYRLMQEWIGEKILVDKSTSYALDQAILERAETHFEDPLYIHLLRHPHGMIHSFEEVRMDQVFFRNQTLFTTRELAELIWLVCHQNILRFLQDVPESRQHRVTFEDLVRRPSPVMKRICGFLGREFHPDMVEPYRNKEKRMTDGIHAESRMVGDMKFHEHNAVNSSVADRWQSRYTNDSLGDVTWRLAESLGYSRGQEKNSPVGQLTTAQASDSEAAKGRLERIVAEVESLSDEEVLRLLAEDATLPR